MGSLDGKNVYEAERLLAKRWPRMHLTPYVSPRVSQDVYEAERLLAKRWPRGAARPQYLVRWVGYGPKHASSCILSACIRPLPYI